MSISALLEPNLLDIFAHSVTTTEPPQISGKLNITNNTTNGTGNITINQTNLASTANDILFESNGFGILYIGVNPSTSQSYIDALTDLRIIAGGVERLKILGTGINLNNSSTQILGFAPGSDILVYRNNLVSLDDSQIIINKTISSADNLIEINGIDVNTLINQDVTTNATPSFMGLSSTGNINITGISNDDTASQVLALQLDGTLVYKNNVADTSSVQTFTNKTINGANLNGCKYRLFNVTNALEFDTTALTTDKLYIVPDAPSMTSQFILDVSTNTLTNKSIDSATNTITVNSTNINSIINQPLLMTSGVTFDNVALTNGMTEWGTKYQEFHGTVSRSAGFGAFLMYSTSEIPISTIILEVKLFGVATAGPNQYTGINQDVVCSVTADNTIAGTTVNTTFVVNNQNTLSGGFNLNVADPVIGLYITDDVANDINWAYFIKVYFM